MYDIITSSYTLGSGFHRELQTKDLNCLMSTYWIDPAGQLFEIDYSFTQDIELDNDGIMFQVVSNKNHGKVTPVFLNKTIEVYPSKWDAYYAPFPRINLTFIDGVLCK
jgi:hypothetical protein